MVARFRGCKTFSTASVAVRVQNFQFQFIQDGQGEQSILQKNIRRFYSKITGNQLPVHFSIFFTGARKHFQEHFQELGTVR